MPRTKEFSPDEALDACLDVFWANGYEKTSLDALMQASGVARQSLYDTFGDKRSLYLLALARYRDTNHAALRARFSSGQPVRENVAAVLLGLCAEGRSSLQRGCLLLSANLERDSDDKEIAQLLRDNQLMLEHIFTRAFEDAKARGELRPSHDALALARFFVATIQGIRACARNDPNRRALEQVAHVALAALD
jgi:TetR/AcrR family transcriptional regulator, transcriptional repressor for nem operon